MDVGHFYFLSEQYYKDFPDPYLMQNHETINGVAHDRPCFYAFQENDNGILEKELIAKAKKVLALQRKGVKLVFPDIASIEKQLLAK